MTNEALAQNLLDAERARDVEEIIYAESAIAERLGIPLDQTEQGLTPEAGKRITDFVVRYAQ